MSETLANQQDEQYIEHEVKLRILKSQNEEIYKKFDKLEDRIERMFDKLDAKIDSRFLLLIVLIPSSIILPVVLHLFKLM